MRVLYGSFKIWQVDRRLKTRKRGFTTQVKSEGNFKRREPIQKLIDLARQGVHLEHRQRLAILCELINTPMSDEEIINIFNEQDDFNPRKIQYYINSARRHAYKPLTREHLIEVLPNA